jgi:hypothetical protein
LLKFALDRTEGAGPTAEAKYFCEKDWTTQISLNRLDKLEFWRTQIQGPASPPRQAHPAKNA